MRWESPAKESSPVRDSVIALPAKEPVVTTESNAEGGSVTAAAGNEIKTTISGLKLGTTYYIRAYAKNEHGLSYGPVKQYSTKRAPEPGDIDNPSKN